MIAKTLSIEKIAETTRLNPPTLNKQINIKLTYN